MKKLFDTHNWFLVNKNWPDKKAKEKKCNLRKTKLHWNTGRLRSKKQLSGGVKTNKVFFQHQQQKACRRQCILCTLRKWHNRGKGVEELSFSALRHNTLHSVCCEREGLIKINIKVSDSLSNLNRRELGVAP